MNKNVCDISVKSEDDTFKVLSRPIFKDMRNIVLCEFQHRNTIDYFRWTRDTLTKFLKIYNWEYKDYESSIFT
jgi:hypothetical protein